MIFSFSVLCFSSCTKNENGSLKEGYEYVENEDRTFSFTIKTDEPNFTDVQPSSVVIGLSDHATISAMGYYLTGGDKPFADIDEFINAFVTFTDKADFYGQMNLSEYEDVKIGNSKNGRKFKILTPSVITDVTIIETETSFYVFSTGYSEEQYNESKIRVEEIINTFKEIKK